MIRFDVSTRIAVFYAVVGSLWIVASDWAVVRLVDDPATAARIQTFKGWAFVALSTLLVYALIRLYLERKDRERERLRRLQAELEEAQRIAEVGSWALDVGSGELRWSDEVYRIFGVERASFKPGYGSFMESVYEEDRERMEAAQKAALSGKAPLDVTHRIVRPDGEVRWVRERAEVTRTAGGGALELIGTVQDVTASVLAEERLRESEQQLKALSAHLQEAREEERHRLSMDIHDQVGGTLAGVKMTLTRLLDAIPEEDTKRREMALRVQEGLERTIRSVRDLAREMHPGVLDELGLPAAVESLADDFRTRFDGAVELTLRGEELVDLPPDRAIHLFRIAQEALTNVARHAGADRVEITLEGREGAIALTVVDDGRGFPTRANGRNMGLLNMRERAALLGGHLDVRSSPGAGTELRARVPRGATPPEAT